MLWAVCWKKYILYLKRFVEILLKWKSSETNLGSKELTRKLWSSNTPAAAQDNLAKALRCWRSSSILLLSLLKAGTIDLISKAAAAIFSLIWKACIESCAIWFFHYNILFENYSFCARLTYIEKWRTLFYFSLSKLYHVNKILANTHGRGGVQPYEEGVGRCGLPSRLRSLPCPIHWRLMEDKHSQPPVSMANGLEHTGCR